MDNIECAPPSCHFVRLESIIGTFTFVLITFSTTFQILMNFSPPRSIWHFQRGRTKGIASSEKIRKRELNEYLMDRKAMCWERAWKKKWAPWRNTTIPVQPSRNNSTVISILILLLQPNTALKPPEAEESEGKE
jgi:hypothetical protein